MRTDTLVEMVAEMAGGTVEETEADEERENGIEDVTIDDKMIDHLDATEIYLTIADKEVEVEATVEEEEAEDVIEEDEMMEDLLRNKERRVLLLHQRRKSPHQI